MTEAATVRPRRAARPLLAGALMAAGPIALLLDSALARARGWLPRSPFEARSEWAAVLALAVVMAILARPSLRSRLGAAWPLVVTWMLAGATTLVAAELLLARVAPLPAFHLRAPGRRWLFTPARSLLPGVEGPARYTTNSGGIRGPELDQGERYRVLCVGGSTTECLYLDDEESWPALVAGGLASAQAPWGPVWVGAAGRSGFTAREHAEFLASTPLLAQVDCVVVLAGVNELRTACLLDGQQRARSRPGRPPAWANSSVKNSLARWLEGWSESVLDVDGGFHAAQRARRARAPRVPAPDLGAASTEFRGYLESLATRCQVAGRRLIFLTQPTIWRPGLPPEVEALLWFGDVPGRQGYVSVEGLQAAMSTINAVTREVARRRGVELIELEHLSGQADLFYDDCHFNERGAQAVADELTRWLLEHPPR